MVNGTLSDVPPEALTVCKKLKRLDLHGNNITELRKNQFKGLRDLELLDISFNSIKKIDASHLSDLKKLIWLNASHNEISEIIR